MCIHSGHLALTRDSEQVEDDDADDTPKDADDILNAPSIQVVQARSENLPRPVDLWLPTPAL